MKGWGYDTIVKKDKEGVTLGRSNCRCGSTKFEKVDITPVGMVDKKFFTRCSKCGLVIAGSEDPSKKKNTSQCSILHIVRDALECDK
jgi:hypothetical protein